MVLLSLSWVSILLIANTESIWIQPKFFLLQIKHISSCSILNGDQTSYIITLLYGTEDLPSPPHIPQHCLSYPAQQRYPAGNGVPLFMNQVQFSPF